MERFAKDWGDYSKNELLKKIKIKSLSWELLFTEIIKYASTQRVLIAFDEIQWLAKSKSGFIGTIKKLWPEIEATANIRLVICGSSNKFFKDFTGGEEQILRGIKTRSDIVVTPFTLQEVFENYFPKYKKEEVLFIYMLIGGIPYYLNQFDKKLNFIQSLNKMFFTKESIFTEEVNEILKLEFNKAGLLTIKKILAVLGGAGKVFTEIQKKSKIPPGTLAEAIEKLTGYEIVFEVAPFFGKQFEIKKGFKYKMKDFYLNFFFQIINPNLRIINRNDENELIVNKIFNWPQSFYYVENFSGQAFENLIDFILRSSSKRHEALFKKLGLENINFEINTHWDKEKQIDLVITDTDHRQLRFIECKWTSSLELIKDEIINFSLKVQNHQSDSNPLLAVIVPIKWNKKLSDFAFSHGVTLITQEDLF